MKRPPLRNMWPLWFSMLVVLTSAQESKLTQELPSFGNHKQVPVRIDKTKAAKFRYEAQRFALTASLANNDMAHKEQLYAQKVLAFADLNDSVSNEFATARDAVSSFAQEFVNSVQEPSIKYAGVIFFDDLLRRYDRLTAPVHNLTPFGYRAVHDDLMSEIENTAAAYQVVADNESLTFDLVVQSVPQEGIVSYKRAGDAYTQGPNSTNTTIENLVYAVWTIRVHRDGYRDQEKTHDALHQRNHVLYFILEKSP